MAVAYGLRIKHPVTGVVLLEITDRITRTIGTISTGTANGSYSVDPSLGVAFFICSVSSTFDAMQLVPKIYTNGNVISWVFDMVPGYTPVPVIIQYGVY